MSGSEGEGGHVFASLEEEEMFFLTNICGAMFVIFCVAVIAGLFLGLLTLDALDLQITERASFDPDERKYAGTLHPIVKERHLLLVTLLTLNALSYEALPIFLDKLVPGWAAILLSTTLVLLFGEIIPSAIFTGPDQLRLGYYMVPLVKVLLFIMYPICKPMSLILDKIVHGSEPPPEEAYNRGELAALVKIQFEERMKKKKSGMAGKKNLLWDQASPTHQQYTPNDSYHALKRELMEAVEEIQEDDASFDMETQMRPPMEPEEVNVVLGALQLKTKVAMDVYTPIRHVYAIPEDLVLTKDAVASIYGQGFSRVPVYQKNPEFEEDQSIVLGYIMSRQLMLIDWEHLREVNTLPLYYPDAVSPRMNLVRLLHVLRQGGSHMAFVCARPDLANRSLQKGLPVPVEAGFMGIVTLEDIMESILRQRIYDEVDLRDRSLAIATLQAWAASTLQRFSRKRLQKKRRKGNFYVMNGDTDNHSFEATPHEKTRLLGFDRNPHRY